MDTTIFETLTQTCSRKLPGEIDKILTAAKGQKACAISFITKRHWKHMDFKEVHKNEGHDRVLRTGL